MQVKIVIGTVAFMLTMMIMGFAALQEPHRLSEYTEAREGRQIEAGAKLYTDNCLTCHGVNGRAEECFDTSGNQIGCVGLPLNYAPLLCGDISQRMQTMNWDGSKDAYVRQTIAAGRIGTEMPTWSEEFGGPMRDDQVEDVVMFVLNWETEELCSAPIITFDWPEMVDDYLAEYPEGDAARGEELYLSYGCTGCHGNLTDEASAVVGPWQGNLEEVAPTRIEGVSGLQYVYDSILYPSDYIVEECPTGPCAGPPSAMPANFPDRMGENPQDMRDILEYLMGPIE